MDLDRQARRLYNLGIVTSPMITAWEASFDDGVTYIAGTPVTGGCTWLVRGPDAAAGAAVAVITKTTKPKIRAVDNPEILVEHEDVPMIRYRA